MNSYGHGVPTSNGFGLIGAPIKNPPRLFVHSNVNGVNFTGFNHHNHYGDEQLLEGLPGD